jgi:hypothetical protein
MLNASKKGLSIFDNFEVNRSNAHRLVPGQGVGIADGTMIGTASSFEVFPPAGDNWYVKLKNRVKAKLFNPDKYFQSIKDQITDAPYEPDSAKTAELLYNRAEKFNQTALQESLKKELGRIHKEITLRKHNFSRFISEDVVVKLSINAPDINLTWIKNFIRPIPLDVTKKYLEAQAIDVFDNYVVMHYGDPTDSVAETEEEIEKRKDPILFGVFRESKRLYFIADWIDEYCDLTLEKLIKLSDIKDSDLLLTDEKIADVRKI